MRAQSHGKTWEINMLHRRAFLLGTSALGLAALGGCAPAESEIPGFVRVPITRERKSGTQNSYSQRRVEDPLQVMQRPVDRFELRGGDCSGNNDCFPRQLGSGVVTRARTERVLETNLRSGTALFRYQIYVPSSEFEPAKYVSVALGQFLSGDDDDSMPIFILNMFTDGMSSRVVAKVNEAPKDESLRERSQTIELVQSADFFDRWIQVEVLVDLSTEEDGSITVTFDGTEYPTFRGPTLRPSQRVELRYGVYHTGTNRFPGGAENVPDQVVYYANVGLYRRI
jgi:hypothetical protein